MFSKQDKKLKIMSLGQFSHVTQNMFVYEYKDNILVVDCGMGFINGEEAQNDLLIPDISYLHQNQRKIRGIILTHGHEDHIGGLSYVLPKIGTDIPIYGSKLTVALAKARLEESGIFTTKLYEISSDDQFNLGPFGLRFVHVTHSIPDTFNVVILTPLGTIYHASDYKFDWTPVMDKPTEVAKIAHFGQKGITLLLSDCLRSERTGYTPSEQLIEDSLEREIKTCKGRFFVTTMSSNVSRWQQAIEAAVARGRKIVLLGRSVEKIIKIAADMGYLKLSQKWIVPAGRAKNYAPNQLALLISGSQAQPNSALQKLAEGKLRHIKIEPKDKVVFSSDYIPGNEVGVGKLIDQLSRLGADVSYSGILDDLHVSGHGAQLDHALMISLTRPKYLLPIGGEFRHMKQFSLFAQKMGYEAERILLPTENQTIEVWEGGQVRLGQAIQLHLNRVTQK